MLPELVLNRKSLGNAALEPLALGVAWCAMWIVRLGWFSLARMDNRKVSRIMLAGIVAVALALYFAIPPLSE